MRKRNVERLPGLFEEVAPVIDDEADGLAAKLLVENALHCSRVGLIDAVNRSYLRRGIAAPYVLLKSLERLGCDVDGDQAPRMPEVLRTGRRCRP